MNEIRTSGSLLFTEPNNPTRVGEIINTLNEIYDIPMPRLGMSVYVKDEGVNYTITKLEPKLIEGVLVPDAKVAGYELQTGKSIAWNSSSNVNDYVVAGVYNITGERLNVNDGLPIANSNSGHTISARLVVLDSSIKGTGDSQDKCITQVLTLSNRTGEDGNMYIRTASGASLDSLTWKPWATQQTNVNVGQVTSLDSFIDNGIYSGVFVESGVPSTFVMIVINDYFVGVSPRRVSQFLCKLNKADGTVSFIYRVGVGNSVLEWGSWVDSTKELQRLIDKNVTDITNEETRAKAEETAIRKLITDLIGESPETLDSIHEISSWILNDQTGAAAMIRQINNLNNVTESTLDALGEEINRATKEENIIRSKALHYNSLNAIPTAEEVNIGGKSVDGSNTLSMAIPTATTETAGVITANDKKKLNNLAVEGADVDLNTYHLDGVYVLSNKKLTNVPILNDSVVSVRLTVLTAYDGTSPVITQVLTLNNLGGGEGNIYIRSKQNSTWKPWGKLQINVEVGQITPDDMSSLIDNGIYSGVCVDGTTVETFVLIVINNYLAASQAGFGSYISQLKYAIDLNRGNTVKTRTRDAYGIWSEWSDVDTRELVEKKDVISVVNDSENPVQSKAIAAAIEEGEKRALRRLFIAAGAEYNDSGADKAKTAPWGEIVTHKAGYYYLNGLGDITEAQMTKIYNSQKNVLYPQAYTQFTGNRTYISDVGQTSFAGPIDLSLLCAGNYNLEVFGNERSPQIYLNEGNLNCGFWGCTKLKHIASERIFVKNAKFTSTFKNCGSLITVKFQRLSNSISFSDSPNISKDSILYLINKAQPTSAITITLHPDAYARLTNDADVVAALEAQPLISLVSA